MEKKKAPTFCLLDQNDVKFCEQEYQKIMQEANQILQKRGCHTLKEAMSLISLEQIESKNIIDALLSYKKGWKDFLRPTLLSLSCEAVGGNPTSAAPVALATTHISGAIELIDDIIDKSKVKHSKKTMLGKYGQDIVLLTSTALLFTGFTQLHKLLEKNMPVKQFSQVAEIIKQGFFKLGDAAALELSFKGDLGVKPEEYLNMVEKKAADVESHTHIGSLLGGGTKKEIRLLQEYGRLLGMLMILRDDLEDMLDFRGEFLHRIKFECLPLPLIYALNKPKTKKKLISILNNNKIDEKDMNKIMEISYQSGSLQDFKETLERIAQKAISITKTVDCSRELEILVKATLPPL